MSDFKTTPIKNSYELMIDRLKAVISDKDAELARLKAEDEQRASQGGSCQQAPKGL